MLARLILMVVLLGAASAWSQVEPSATGGATNPDQMSMPPQVTGDVYPSGGGAEARSNYLAGGLNFNTAYDDNVLAGVNSSPIGDEMYTIAPTISLNQKTPRQSRMLTYSSGFTFYQHTSSLNSVNQNGSLNLQYRASERASIRLDDSFNQSSNGFNQLGSPSAGLASGSTSTPTTAIVIPFGKQLTNAGTVDVSYQFSENGMIGAGGNTALLHIPNLTQVSGLSQYVSGGATAFYNHRYSRSQSFGGMYQFSYVATNPVNTETQTHAVSMMYALSLKQALALSISGGVQRYAISQTGAPHTGSWTPTVTASLGFRTARFSVGASVSRTVSGGGALVGTYNMTNANASANWQMERRWTVQTAVGYISTNNLSPLQLGASPSGNSVEGTLSAAHPITETLSVNFGYTRLHQNYSGISVISSAPDSDREYISVAYNFKRPLGR